MTEKNGVERSTATDVLRRLLDECGVEWGDDGYPTTCTVWASDGIVWHGLWRDDCIELIAHLTPEQAIAATLGAGACKPATYDEGYVGTLVEPGEYYEFWEPACACSECGELIPMRKFCPNCGRRIEQ